MGTPANLTPYGAPGPQTAKTAEPALLRELDHRMANSLQLAADFLLLQQVRLTDPVARSALIDAAERLVAVGHLHRFLAGHDPEASVDLAPFLHELAALIGQTTGLRATAACENLRVSAGFAQTLGLAVNELAINAAKHAYDRGAGGDLQIRGVSDGHTLHLTVADRGRGLGPARAMGAGLGLDIVTALVRQLDGSLETRDANGACFILRVPLPAPRRAEPRTFLAPR